MLSCGLVGQRLGVLCCSRISLAALAAEKLFGLAADRAGRYERETHIYVLLGYSRILRSCYGIVFRIELAR